MREHVLLFCLLVLVLTATIILVAAPGAVTWALALANELMLVMRDRRTHPSRQRTYRYLHVRVDRLEDAISHFYNVINELRRHVSTLEKQLKPLAKDGDLPGGRGALATDADHAA